MFAQDRSWAISDFHIDALNHLLHVKTGNTERRKQTFESFRYYSPRLEELIGALTERGIAASRALPQYAIFKRDLKLLRDAVRKTRVSAVRLHEAAAKSLRSPDSEFSDGTGDIYLASESWIRFLRYAALVLDSASVDLRDTWLDKPEEAWVELAESLQALINAKDPVHRAQNAKEHARLRQGKPSLQGVTPSDEDAEAARWEIIENAHQSLGPLDEYLNREGVRFRLNVDSLSRPSVLIERHDLPTGLAPHGLFASLLLPFIDYLCDPAPKTALAVCSEPACGAIFSRKGRPRSAFCRKSCEP